MSIYKVFSAFSAFMLGYHVHEKAIMTAIIPLTLLATTSIDNARIFIRTCAFGLFGLFPLLFQPEELLIKSFLFLTWMLMTVYGLESLHFKNRRGGLLTYIDMMNFAVLFCVFAFMEIIHPIVFMPSGRLEFLPLMITSVICAIGLMSCWVLSGLQMVKCLDIKNKHD
jgi:alpha-1,3-glucosyltransferase